MLQVQHGLWHKSWYGMYLVVVEHKWKVKVIYPYDMVVTSGIL